MKRLFLLNLALAAACNDDDDPITASTPATATAPATGTSTTAEDPDTTDLLDPTTGVAASSTTDATTGPADLTTPPVDDDSSSGAPMCLPATQACVDTAECCAGLECGTTTLGQVCCGLEGIPCTTPNGEDCCGDLLCVDGLCGYDVADDCGPPCTQPPALLLEKQRLGAIGGTFLGICGDANHTYGYHVPAANLPADDYSLEGPQNVPVCEWHASAIDIGMDWPVSRDWLKWLIPRIANDDIQGIAEVIGSYDGVNVRYWSDGTGWSVDGVPYQGEGHDTHTHVAIYRSTALADHGILLGWTANGGP